MSEKKPSANNKTIKDTSITAADETTVDKTGKTSSIKKTPSKKTSTVNKKPTVPDKSDTPDTVDSVAVAAMQSLVIEMNKERESRDRQMTSLLDEFRTGFDTLNKQNDRQGEKRASEITGLYESLQKAISEIHHGNEQREKLNLNTFQSLSDSIMKDHEQTLMEVHEQEKLQDKKLKYIDKVQNQRISRNRLIAVPAVILAIVGIIYMFNVVHIMETAMTSMSQDMSKIQVSVGTMSSKIETISRNTTSMNTNMEALDGNTQQISKDLNVMTHNVAPAMQGMRDMMPWTR
ncbi:MAG: hypothetical protein RQ982_10075 [Gammaproteobacteria bacterium]|nr:hypothetical protein [Gammaproteobacteria bacterium]